MGESTQAELPSVGWEEADRRRWRAGVWRRGALCALLGAMGGLTALAFIDPPADLIHLPDGQQMEVEAVTLGESVALRGGLLPRWITQALPEEFHRLWGVRRFQCNKGDTPLYLWLSVRPALPADRVLVALTMSPNSTAPLPEITVASDDPLTPTFSFRRLPRQAGAMRFGLFMAKRGALVDAATLPRHPERLDLRRIGELKVSIPSGEAFARWKPATLPTKAEERGIEWEILGMQRVGPESDRTFAQERVRLTYRLLRHGLPTKAWLVDQTVRIEGAKGEEAEVAAETPRRLAPGTLDLTMPRFSATPTLRLTVYPRFQGSLEEAPDGAMLDTIFDIPVVRPAETRRVATLRPRHGKPVYVISQGPGAPQYSSWGSFKQAMHALVFQRGEERIGMRAINSMVTVLEGVDQQGRRICFEPMETPGVNPSLDWDRFPFQPHPDATTLTVRRAQFEPVALSVEIPNPYYLVASSQR